MQQHGLKKWFACSIFLLALCMQIVAARSRAESARFYNLEGFGEFLDGNPESTAVTEDGAITLPPYVRETFADAAASFSAAAPWGKDNVVVARNDTGEVLLINKAGKSRALAKKEGALFTALLVQEDFVYVAMDAPAKILQINDDGESSIYYELEAGVVWDMAVGPKDSLLLATGEPAQIIRITGKNKGKAIFRPEQSQLRRVDYHPDFGIFAGGGERGILYCAKDSKKFRALYDTGHPEITSLAVLGKHVYVAGVTGAHLLAAAPSDEDAGSKLGGDVRSQVVQVAMDGSAETIAGSNDEAVFDMAVYGDRILVATGATGRDEPRGRLYAIEPTKRDISMLYQSESRRLTHLLTFPSNSMAVVAGGGARILHITRSLAKSGVFYTLPYDTGINSQFGSASVSCQCAKGTKVKVAVRTGQTRKPDETWSDWSKNFDIRRRATPNVPNGRYVQVRLTLYASGDTAPSVYRVRLAYVRQNLPPFVREVVTLQKGLALFAVRSEKPKSKTVSLAGRGKKDSNHADKKEKNDKPMTNRAREVQQPGALTVKWLAEDPNGDELSYDLSVRHLGSDDWRTMETDLDDPFFTLQSAQLPDGHYQFRVRATDEASNPLERSLEAFRESRFVLVDNTAPRIEPMRVSTKDEVAMVRVTARDNVGPLMQAEYAVDGNAFRPASPDDGVLDDAEEAFTIHLKDLAPGSHALTFRVMDEADNEGFGETRFVTK